MYECFRERDNETPFTYYADDIEWDARGASLLGLDQVYRGHDGIRTFWRQWLDAWDEIEFETTEPEVLADGRIQVIVRQRNRGRGTGIWVDQRPYSHRWTLVDGMVTRLEFHWVDADQA